MKKSKILIAATIVAIFAVGVGLMAKSDDKNENSQKQNLTTMTLALDWTPNTNHTGIYVAQAKGFYREQGIELKLLPYSASAPSDTLVVANKADAGIGFSEGVVSNSAAGRPVTSIAAIVAHNTSLVLARKDSGITSPKDLDGKTYGGYGAPYEQAVMSAMIRRSGGQGEFKNITVDTDPLDALEKKRVDFVWVFDGWEGIQAKKRGLDVVKFYPTEHGIPDYSTPNLITSPETSKNKSELLKKFMKATATGYEYARQNPDDSAKILIEQAPQGTFPDIALVYESQKYLSEHYQEKGKKWGIQEANFWRKYPEFMISQKAIVDANGQPVGSIDYAALFTNQFLE